MVRNFTYATGSCPGGYTQEKLRVRSGIKGPRSMLSAELGCDDGKIKEKELERDTVT